MSRPRPDVAVINGRVVGPDGVSSGGVAITDGRVSRILVPSDNPDADRVLDAQGCYLLPGLVDSHVHFRTPGLTYKEDWAHASRAAAAGGVTTVIDMPNTSPPLFDPARAPEKAELIEGRSLVDFRFHLGVDGCRPDLLMGATPRAAVSAKLFLAGHHTAPHAVSDPDQIDHVFRLAAETGLRLVLHAEDDRIFALLDAWSGEPNAYVDYERRRPRSGAIVAVAKVLELVRRHGTAAHVLHVSSAEEADLLAAGAAAGLPVTFEVTAHHLTFVADDVDRLGPRVRLSPAIREESDRARLWEAVVNGEVSSIGSDHAPHTAAEKLVRPPAVPPGLPGIQELLPAVHTGLARRFPAIDADTRMRLVSRLLASGPSDLFGMSRQKGRLSVGLDGDLVVFDADATWSLAPADVQSKCGWSAYEGRPMVGRPVMTLRRGEVIWDSATGRFGEPNGVWLGADRPSDGVATEKEESNGLLGVSHRGTSNNQRAEERVECP